MKDQVRQDKGTHKSMGKKGGASAGLEDGVASVDKFKAGMGQNICEGSDGGTQRAKPEDLGSIANK